MRAANGSEERGDTLVGADGLWSLVRASIAPATPSLRWEHRLALHLAAVDPTGPGQRIHGGPVSASVSSRHCRSRPPTPLPPRTPPRARPRTSASAEPSRCGASRLALYRSKRCSKRPRQRDPAQRRLLPRSVTAVERGPAPSAARRRSRPRHHARGRAGRGDGNRRMPSCSPADELVAADELGAGLVRHEVNPAPPYRTGPEVSRRADSAAESAELVPQAIGNPVVRRTPRRLDVRQLERIVIIICRRRACESARRRSDDRNCQLQLESRDRDRMDTEVGAGTMSRARNLGGAYS